MKLISFLTKEDYFSRNLAWLLNAGGTRWSVKETVLRKRKLWDENRHSCAIPEYRATRKCSWKLRIQKIHKSIDWHLGLSATVRVDVYSPIFLEPITTKWWNFMTCCRINSTNYYESHNFLSSLIICCITFVKLRSTSFENNLSLLMFEHEETGQILFLWVPSDMHSCWFFPLDREKSKKVFFW